MCAAAVGVTVRGVRWLHVSCNSSCGCERRLSVARELRLWLWLLQSFSGSAHGGANPPSTLSQQILLHAAAATQFWEPLLHFNGFSTLEQGLALLAWLQPAPL